MSCFALVCSRTSTTSFRSPNTSISSSASNLFGNNAGQTPKQKSSTLPARAKWRTIEINLLSLLVLITPVAHTFVYISLSRFSILHTLSFSFEQANKINATFLSHVLRLFWCYLLPFLLSSSSSSSCFSCAILFFYDLIVWNPNSSEFSGRF